MTPLATTAITAPGARPDRWMVVLHGILGTRANWRSIARAHTAAHPDRGVALVDLRHHGESQAVSGPDTLDQCARDVARTVRAHAWRCDAVLGHSFGGKVAATWCATLEDSPERLLVVDAPLRAGFVASEPSVASVIEHLRALPHTHPSRGAFIEALTQRGLPQAIAAWLSMNLRRMPEGNVRWPLDLDAIQRLLDDYLATDLTGLIDGRMGPGVRLLVVAGGRSPAWPPEDQEAFAASASPARAALWRLPDAGHWVHADDPAGLLDAMASFEAGRCWRAPHPA